MSVANGNDGHVTLAEGASRRIAIIDADAHNVRMPMALAPARPRSTQRRLPNGPRSLTFATIDWPFSRLVIVTMLPKGSVR